MKKLKSWFKGSFKLSKKELYAISLISGVAMGFFTIALFLSPQKEEPTQSQEVEIVEQVVLTEDLSDATYSVLLLGRGGAGHSGGTLTDSIILLMVDPATKGAVMVSIPRDLWVSLPTDFENETNHKINEAYAIAVDDVKYANKRPEFKGIHGAGEFSKYAASQVTGIPADYYIDIDFDGFVRAINLLGGIEVDSPHTFDDYNYPVRGLENELCGFSPEKVAQLHVDYSGYALEQQFTCRYEHIHFDEGPITLTGDEALKYVRSRHAAVHGGDFARSARQFAVIKGLVAKIFSLDIIPKADDLFDNLLGAVKTDIPIEKMAEIAAILGNPEDYEVVSIQLTEENVLVSSRNSRGQFILLPRAGEGDWDEVKQFIANQI